MTETHLQICNVLAHVLFETPLECDTGIDWNIVHHEMREQTVQGLVGSALSELPLSEELKKSWEQENKAIIYNGIKKAYAQTRIDQLFEKEKIPYVIIKGTAAAIYYPEPLLRSMGDIDLYVPSSHFIQAVKVMRENGYIENLRDMDNPRHLSFFGDQVYIELHKKYATVNSLKQKNYIDGLLNTCSLKECREPDNVGWVRYTDKFMNFKMPSPNANGLMLLEHIAHHMMGGIGLRQVIDWIVYVNAVLDDENWIEFQEMAQKAGLLELAKAITKTGQLYFGLPGSITWCKDYDTNVCDEFLEYIFSNGNFGRKQREIGKIAIVRNKSMGLSGFFTNLQRAGEYNWKAYKKHHWLRPIAWIYQFGRYTRQVMTNPKIIYNLFGANSEIKRRRRLLSRLGLFD